MSRKLSVQSLGATFHLMNRELLLVCALGLAPCLLDLSERAAAATITNYLGIPWQQANLAVNVGDTVVWVNQQTSPSTNYVESYGGEWKAALPNQGDSFSFTFTNAGFYAYRTGLPSVTFTYPVNVGTVAVNGWTDTVPAVTINTPVNGFYFPGDYAWPPMLVQSSVTNNERITAVQYFANGSLIGTAGSPPYSLAWTNPPEGVYMLVAKALDREGGEALSRPVRVMFSTPPSLWGPHVLSGGQLLLFFKGWGNGRTALFSVDSLPYPYTNVQIKGAIMDGQAGTFVDDSLPDPAVQARYYFWRGRAK
jgi:Bacterial Ig domain